MTTTSTAQEQELLETVSFPVDFVWGTATAAYQIEGAINEDGRAPSIWDTFSATPGKVLEGHTGAVACDHYHRWREDIALMRDLGLNGYRFSIAWSRILPDGTGRVNQAGLDFYDRLVDGLLEAGIQPYATLYHWDLPQALQDKGGWTNRETAYAFAEYARVVVERLGDRVKGWITHNEPWCASFLGYGTGEHAPGEKDKGKTLQAVHHLLLSHGLAMQEIRRLAPQATAGITLNLWPVHAENPQNPADVEAARKVDTEYNQLFLNPIFKGAYPADYEFLAQLPVQAGDLEIIAAPVDFLGINYYNRRVVRDNNGRIESVNPTGTYTTMNWEVYPEGIYELTSRVHRDYQPKQIFITENGASGEEAPDLNGRVQDELRTSYLQTHLAQLHRAIQEGVPLAGYFAWSLLDNFEWAWGYTRRFGIVYVDFDTQKRTIKDSGHWYKNFVGKQRSII